MRNELLRWGVGALVGGVLLGAVGAGGCAPRETLPPPEAAPPAPREAAAAPEVFVVPPFTPQVQAALEVEARAVIGQARFSIPVSARPAVLRTLHHIQHHGEARALMEASLAGAARYRKEISAVLSRDGLPVELFHVAQAESAFLAADLQGKGLAVGLWQLVPSTARHYGLRVGDGFDDRTDVFKSTDAAARLLVDLHATFQDWELAITGFYAGAGIVSRGLELAGTRDAWALLETPDALPAECRGYLPYVYALAIVSQAPTRFGFNPKEDPAWMADVQRDFPRYYTHRYPDDLFPRATSP